jgi:hypothetical protein
MKNKSSLARRLWRAAADCEVPVRRATCAWVKVRAVR